MDIDFNKFIWSSAGLQNYMVAEGGVVYADSQTGEIFVEQAGSFVPWVPAVVGQGTDPQSGEVFDIFDSIKLINWPLGAGLPYENNATSVQVIES